MQLLPSTGAEVAENLGIEFSEEKLLDPEYNVNLGINYFCLLYEKYQNLGIALAAYNAGSGNVDKWINEGILEKDGTNLENIPFDETNMYVRKILRDYEVYQKVYK